MSDTPEHPVKLPLRLRANPDIDSPESLLATISRLTEAYFDVGDFPIDALIAALMRSEAVILLLHGQIGNEERVSDEVIGNALWALEGLNAEALTLARLWGRHVRFTC